MQCTAIFSVWIKYSAVHYSRGKRKYHFGLDAKVQFAAYSPMQDVAVQRSQKMQRVIRNNQPLNRVDKE